MANENDMRIVETARSAYEKIELFGDGGTGVTGMLWMLWAVAAATI